MGVIERDPSRTLPVQTEMKWVASLNVEVRTVKPAVKMLVDPLLTLVLTESSQAKEFLTTEKKSAQNS